LINDAAVARRWRCGKAAPCRAQSNGARQIKCFFFKAAFVLNTLEKVVACCCGQCGVDVTTCQAKALNRSAWKSMKNCNTEYPKTKKEVFLKRAKLSPVA
jgi:hypothetical protein